MNYCTCTCMQVYSSYKMYNRICTIYMYYSIQCMYVNVLHVLHMVCTCTTCTGIIISTSIIITSISTNIHTV